MFDFFSLNGTSTKVDGALTSVFPALLVLVLLLPGIATAQERSPDTSEMIDFINDLRSESRYCGDTYFEAADPLLWDDDLKKAALTHVKDMIINDYFAHESPAGVRLFDRVRDVTDRFRSPSENIARGQNTAADVLYSWIESPGHCANIMRPHSTHVGVAVRTGSEVENDHGLTEPFWTMKLATARDESDRATPVTGRSASESAKNLVHLELDRDIIIDRLNEIRNEGVYCREDSDSINSSFHKIEWHEDIEKTARKRAVTIAENQREIIRGEDRRTDRDWIRSDGFSLGSYLIEKGTEDFEETLTKWKSDLRSCFFLISDNITYAGVAAVVTEDDQVYWVLMQVTRTPESMSDQLLSFFEGLEITVYGEERCGRTRQLHREFTEIGVAHNFITYDQNDQSNTNMNKMHQASSDADRRLGNMRGLPYVKIDNTLVAGFSSAISLYRILNDLE